MISFNVWLFRIHSLSIWNVSNYDPWLARSMCRYELHESPSGILKSIETFCVVYLFSGIRSIFGKSMITCYVTKRVTLSVSHYIEVSCISKHAIRWHYTKKKHSNYIRNDTSMCFGR